MPDSFPTKESGYIGKEVKCNEGVTAEWNNITWTLSDIKVENKKRIICTVNFSKDTSQATLAEKAKLGDYVEMVPDLSNFDISKELTGCKDSFMCGTEKNITTQTINPSELTTWRIINIKEDGTIEMISEYTSSQGIYFVGVDAYKNLVGTLNLIASAYSNSKFTYGTRCPGYSGQTEVIQTDVNTTSYPNIMGTDGTAITCSTGVCIKEYQAGGDIYYQQDINLIKNALNTLTAKKVGVSEEYNVPYYINGRHYDYGSDSRWNYGGYYCQDNVVLQNNLYYQKGPLITSLIYFRPIVVLRSGLKTSEGDGTSNSHWKLA